MENGECPQEWLRALGGGGGEKLLGLEILHNRTGATASIMLGTKSEPAALLPPINRAMMRTRSLDTEDPAVHGGAIDAHDVDAVEQTAARRAGERGVGHKPHVGPCASNAMDQGGGAIGQTRKLVDTINEYKQNAANMQARLKNMQAMLARFADKEKESKKADHAVHSSSADRTRQLRTIKPCYFLEILNSDAMRKMMHFIHGKHLFMLARTCTAVAEAQDDLELWASKAQAETSQDPSIFRSAKEVKQLYRAMSSDWCSITETFKWLGRMGYPSDVSGTKNGIPLRCRVLDTLKIAIRLTSRRLLNAERVRELSDAALVCLFSLMQASCPNLQELALALGANLMHQNEYGRSVILRHGALHLIRDQIKSHCLGLKKQASRLLVNALIAPQHRVLDGCYAHVMFQPYRGLLDDAIVTDGQGDQIEWVCVEYSPNGEPGPEQKLWFSLGESGSLLAQGTDNFGQYTLRQATLNSALQWAHGPSLDDDQVHRETLIQRRRTVARAAGSAAFDDSGFERVSSFERLPSDPVQLARLCLLEPQSPVPVSTPENDAYTSPHLISRSPSEPISAATTATASPAVNASPTSGSSFLATSPAATGNVNAHTPIRLSGAAGAGVRGSLCKTKLGDGEPTWGLNEAVERMRGFQERYTAGIKAAAGTKKMKILDVADGTEHIEMFKSHGSAHGADHVKFVAFADAHGLWGTWERGRFYYHSKIDGGSCGVFRMWQAPHNLEDTDHLASLTMVSQGGIT